MSDDILKLNIGGGPKRIEGFKNVDGLPWDGATDILHNLINYPWPIEHNSVDEILSEEFLEHVSFKETVSVLSEMYRILKPNGKARIQVPDIGKCMHYWLNKEICACVPHKAKDWESFHADPNCFVCSGRGKINPNRWLYSFTGAQKHEYDIHRNVFTQDTLKKQLQHVGFKDFKWIDNPYKLIVDAYK